MTSIHYLLLAVAYLSGAVPYGYLLTRKSTGLNILEEGSGNIGSTNVGRIAGKAVALQVQLLDMVKGMLPVALVLLLDKLAWLDFPDYYIFLIALLTIIGHNFSIFLGFRGGKGVNTTLGASVLLAPISVFSSVAVYFLVKWQLNFVSAGSIALALFLPVSGYLISSDKLIHVYLLVCCLLILLRHTGNLKRLIAGQERR
jgi:glycerol-3-phosphate acyltransferase PlsY